MITIYNKKKPVPKCLPCRHATAGSPGSSCSHCHSWALEPGSTPAVRCREVAPPGQGEAHHGKPQKKPIGNSWENGDLSIKNRDLMIFIAGFQSLMTFGGNLSVTPTKYLG